MSIVGWAGIDVSAATLTVALQRDDRRHMSCFEVSNDAGGHRKLCRRLQSKRGTVRVTLESTSTYGLDASLALFATPGLEVQVANPRAVAHFGRAVLQRAKTDGVDARLLLEYTRRMDFRAWVPPSAAVMELRSVTRRRRQLVKARTAERNRLHAVATTATTPAVIVTGIKATIDFLSAEVAAMEVHAQEIIATNAELAEQARLLRSIKGVSYVSSAAILAELSVLPSDMTTRQWVAHAGLDPRPRQSGTSLNGRPRLSKAGNRYLRAALYKPAQSASCHQPEVKAFKDCLIERGKTPLAAEVAVMRKLLHCIWGMLRSGTPFDPALFWQPQHSGDQAQPGSQAPRGAPSARRPQSSQAIARSAGQGRRGRHAGSKTSPSPIARDVQFTLARSEHGGMDATGVGRTRAGTSPPRG